MAEEVKKRSRRRFVIRAKGNHAYAAKDGGWTNEQLKARQWFTITAAKRWRDKLGLNAGFEVIPFKKPKRCTCSCHG